MTIGQKYKSLQKILKKLERVVVAYSGGVDSTFLLKVAVDTLGKGNVLACIATGPTLAESQYKQALRVAKKIGAEVKTIEPNEMDDPKFTANKADRCYHCKTHLIKILKKIARQNNLKNIICGNNFDDRLDYRPGWQAIKTFNVQCPLFDARLTKNQIRQLSRKLKLPTADIPASPCLASRLFVKAGLFREAVVMVPNKG
ncbi:Pyridinium-3,5-bisthiocarboxylic acid mononucleotide synthase [subsurface metagenome]